MDVYIYIYVGYVVRTNKIRCSRAPRRAGLLRTEEQAVADEASRVSKGVIGSGFSVREFWYLLWFTLDIFVSSLTEVSTLSLSYGN